MAAAAEALEGGRRVRRARRVALALADDGVGELPGLVEVADADEVLRVRRRGLRDVAPARGFGFDAQEIEQQLVIERAQRRIANRCQPDRDAFGRVVADALDVDRAGAGARQLARVLLRDVLLVRVGRQHPLDALPHLGEALGRTFAGRNLALGQPEQLPLAVGVWHQRLEGQRQPLGRAALLDDRGGDEVRNRLVAHPFHDRAGNVDRADHRFRAVALIEQLQHRFGGELAGGAPHLAEHRVEPMRLGLREVFGEPLQQRHERRHLRRGTVLLGGAVDLRHHFLQPDGVLHDVEQQAHAGIVEVERPSGERRGDDLLGGGRDPLLLAKHFGVVDFLDFDARTAGRRPQVLDAAVGAHVLGRTGEEQQQRAPRFGVDPGIQRQAADELTVQQLGELGDGRIRPAGHGAADEQRVGHHLEAIRAAVGEHRRDLRQASERGANRRVRGRVERNRAGGSLAGPRELGEPRAGVRGKNRRSSGFGHRSQRCASGCDRSGIRVERFLNSVAELVDRPKCGRQDVREDRATSCGRQRRACGRRGRRGVRARGQVSLCRARAQSFEYYCPNANGRRHPPEA